MLRWERFGRSLKESSSDIQHMLSSHNIELSNSRDWGKKKNVGQRMSGKSVYTSAENALKKKKSLELCWIFAPENKSICLLLLPKKNSIRNLLSKFVIWDVELSSDSFFTYFTILKSSKRSLGSSPTSETWDRRDGLANLASQSL